MSEVKQTEQVEVKKVSRRGIGAARGTTRLKFSHEQARQNGLFVGHLESVEVKMIQIGEDTTGMPSFNGLEIPKLVLTFASNEEDANKRRYVVQQFTAVESNANNIPGGTSAWKVDSVFDWMKHILNVYVLKGRELTEVEEAALSLSYEDFDENGEYIPVEPEEVIAGWKVLFENFENILNRGKDGQPYYKDKNGKYLPIWMKLLRYIKNPKKGWQSIIKSGELAFPSFVGEGCVELYKQNVAPSIRVNSINEAIIPMNVEKPKAPNMPTSAMGGSAPIMGGVPVMDPMLGGGTNYGEINAAAEEDMPF